MRDDLIMLNCFAGLVKVWSSWFAKDNKGNKRTMSDHFFSVMIKGMSLKVTHQNSLGFCIVLFFNK